MSQDAADTTIDEPTSANSAPPADELSLERYSAGEWVWLALCTLIGAFLRFKNLAGRPLWTDELTTIITTRRPLADSFTTGQDPQPPLYQLIIRALTGGGGPDAALPSEQLLRAPACFFGIATIPAVWWCARHFLGRVGAAVAALLIAINPLLIHHARDARPYALYVFFATLSITFFYRLIKSGGIANILGYALATIGMFFSHYYAMFFVAGQLVYATLDFIFNGPTRRRIKPVLAALIIAFVGSLPMLWLFYRLITAGMKGSWWIPAPSGFIDGFDALGDMLGLRALGILCVIPLIAAFWLPKVSISLREMVSVSRSETRTFWIAWWLSKERAIYLALLVGFALFLPLIGSLLVKPGWILRYSLAVVVPMIILGLAYLRSAGPAVTVIVLLAIIGLTAPKARNETNDEKGLRDAVAVMLKEKAEGDSIFLPDWKFSDDFVLPEALGMKYYGYTGPYETTSVSWFDAFIYKSSKTLPKELVERILEDPNPLLPPGQTWAICFHSTATPVREFLVKRGRKFREWKFGEYEDKPLYVLLKIEPL